MSIPLIEIMIALLQQSIFQMITSIVLETLARYPFTYHIELKENAQPVVVPPRKLLFAMKETVKRELDKMEKLGVIKKVDKPSY